MDDARRRSGLFSIAALALLAALVVTAGCTRQVRVESGPSESDSTDQDTSSVTLEAEAVPVFERPEVAVRN